jgi:hypothetical protein
MREWLGGSLIDNTHKPAMFLQKGLQQKQANYFWCIGQPEGIKRINQSCCK